MSCQPVRSWRDVDGSVLLGPVSVLVAAAGSQLVARSAVSVIEEVRSQRASANAIAPWITAMLM